MLVLNRRTGQTVIVGEGDKSCLITVLSIKGNYVRLGFEADCSVLISRPDSEWNHNKENKDEQTK